MNAVNLQKELGRLREQQSKSEAEHDQYLQLRDRALAVEPPRFRQNDVDDAKRNIARTEQQIADLQERIAALESQLPTPEHVNAATAEWDALVTQAQTACAERDARWAELLTQLEVAETTARAVAAADGERRTAVAKLPELAARFALNSSVPTMPELDRTEMQIVGLIGLIIRDVGHHQAVDDMASRELSAAKAQRAAVTVTV